MQYRVRKGYRWLNKLNQPTEQTIVSDQDPGFARQKYKLEPVVEGSVAIEEPPAKSDGPNPPKKTRAPADRLAPPAETRTAPLEEPAEDEPREEEDDEPEEEDE